MKKLIIIFVCFFAILIAIILFNLNVYFTITLIVISSLITLIISNYLFEKSNQKEKIENFINSFFN